MSYSKEDIIRMVKEEDVEFIRLQFTDIFGQLKNVAITASQIEKAVNDQIMTAPPSRVLSASTSRISTYTPTWTPSPSSPGGPATAG